MKALKDDRVPSILRHSATTQQIFSSGARVMFRSEARQHLRGVGPNGIFGLLVKVGELLDVYAILVDDVKATSFEPELYKLLLAWNRGQTGGVLCSSLQTFRALSEHALTPKQSHTNQVAHRGRGCGRGTRQHPARPTTSYVTKQQRTLWQKALDLVL